MDKPDIELTSLPNLPTKDQVRSLEDQSKRAVDSLSIEYVNSYNRELELARRVAELATGIDAYPIYGLNDPQGSFERAKQNKKTIIENAVGIVARDTLVARLKDGVVELVVQIGEKYIEQLYNSQGLTGEDPKILEELESYKKKIRERIETELESKLRALDLQHAIAKIIVTQDQSEFVNILKQLDIEGIITSFRSEQFGQLDNAFKEKLTVDFQQMLNNRSIWKRILDGVKQVNYKIEDAPAWQNSLVGDSLTEVTDWTIENQSELEKFKRGELQSATGSIESLFIRLLSKEVINLSTPSKNAIRIVELINTKLDPIQSAIEEANRSRLSALDENSASIEAKINRWSLWNKFQSFARIYERGLEISIVENGSSIPGHQSRWRDLFEFKWIDSSQLKSRNVIEYFKSRIAPNKDVDIADEENKLSGKTLEDMKEISNSLNNFQDLIKASLINGNLDSFRYKGISKEAIIEELNQISDFANTFLALTIKLDKARVQGKGKNAARSEALEKFVKDLKSYVNNVFELFKEESSEGELDVSAQTVGNSSMTIEELMRMANS